MFALANEKPYMAKMPGVGECAVALDQEGQKAQEGFNAAIETAMGLSDVDREDDGDRDDEDNANPVLKRLESLYNLPAIEPENLHTNAPDFDALTPEAVEFLAYLEGKEWLNTFQGVRHYRRYWGERNGYQAEAFLQFLTEINLAGLGAFDDDATKWRSRHYPQSPDERHFE